MVVASPKRSEDDEPPLRSERLFFFALPRRPLATLELIRASAGGEITALTWRMLRWSAEEEEEEEDEWPERDRSSSAAPLSGLMDTLPSKPPALPRARGIVDKVPSLIRAGPCHRDRFLCWRWQKVIP